MWFGRMCPLGPKKVAAKNKNAGLVGPAASLSLHLWGADWLRLCPRGSQNRPRKNLLCYKPSYITAQLKSQFATAPAGPIT